MRNVQWVVGTALLGLLVSPLVRSQTNSEDAWLDRTHAYTYDKLWRSAMGLDRLFGSQESAAVYQTLYGSISPAILWDQFHGFQPKLRFRVNVPLPRLSERFNAVIGRVNPDEFITERAQQSGGIPRQFGPRGDDETVFGLSYRTPRPNGGSYGLGAGVRIHSSLDPYLKGDYTYVHGSPRALLVTARQTLFWQQSENLGVTSRIDLDHFLSERTLLRFTTSGTLSQKSKGLRGFADASLMHTLGSSRAIIGSLNIEWETRAPVSLREFGTVLAYRRSIHREWLIMELRSSVTWPKDVPGAARTPSWGVGVGVEMLFGTTQFQALPVTF